MKKVLQIPGAPAPIGPYSQAVLKNNTLYVSGQIPLNPVSGEIVDENIEKSTTQVLENIKALLKEAEMTMEDVVKCSIFLKDLKNFSVVNQVYASYFTACPPARETVEISRLPMDAIVEISCIAIKA